MANHVLSLLRAVQSGDLSPEDALVQLKLSPFEDLGYAKVDGHRAVRQGTAEVIYGQSKTPEQILGILETMHRQGCENVLVTRIPQETADLINETLANGGRCICVGTPSCRTLESWAAEDGHMEAKSGWTDIYIYPGYRFKVMDGLVTNFHLPESTLIMLVSAFAGREHILNAYNEAVRERYRFFSFGDAMFLY